MATTDIGALFDWDGVIVDSSAAHEESWELLAKEERRPLPPGHFKAGFGRKNTYIVPEILGWTRDTGEIIRIGKRKEALYRDVLKRTSVSVLPGARDLLEGLRTIGIPCAIGSSTDRLNIETCLNLTSLHEFFAAIISADDVIHGKPNPEVFLKAAAAIDRKPARCVVFEDAYAGLEAAHAGGFKSIGVGTTNPVESLRDKCDLAVHRLNELTADTILKLVT